MSNERKFQIKHVAALRGIMVNVFNVAKQFLEAGKEIEITLRERKSMRSLEQNKRYWMMLRNMAAMIWVDGKQFSDEIWHEHCKRTFIGIEEMRMPNGVIQHRGMSTASENTGEFTEYMDAIERWCAEQGYDIWG